MTNAYSNHRLESLQQVQVTFRRSFASSFARSTTTLRHQGSSCLALLKLKATPLAHLDIIEQSCKRELLDLARLFLCFSILNPEAEYPCSLYRHNE